MKRFDNALSKRSGAQLAVRHFFFCLIPHGLRIYSQWTPIQMGVVQIRAELEERAIRLAEYMIDNGATVRAAAARYGVSKSTVHKDLTQRLPDYDPGLYRRVKELLDRNKAERHLRGGAATRRKYKGI